MSLFPCSNSCKWEVTHSPSLPLQYLKMMLFITTLILLEKPVSCLLPRHRHFYVASTTLNYM